MPAKENQIIFLLNKILKKCDILVQVKRSCNCLTFIKFFFFSILLNNF